MSYRDTSHGEGKAVLREGLLLMYCAAVGFVAAGTAASLYKMLTLEAPRFTLLGTGWGGLLATFFFCALTGPAIMMEMVIHKRLADHRAVGTILGGVLIAALWSAVSGVVVLDIILSLRDGLA